MMAICERGGGGAEMDESEAEEESLKEKKSHMAKRASQAFMKTMDFATTALRRKGTEPSFLPTQSVEVTSCSN